MNFEKSGNFEPGISSEPGTDSGFGADFDSCASYDSGASCDSSASYDSGKGMEFDADSDIYAAVEAILMSASEPILPESIANALNSAGISADFGQIETVLNDLRDEYDGNQNESSQNESSQSDNSPVRTVGRARGFCLKRSVRGWQLCTRAGFENVVSAFVSGGKTPGLSQAAMETLAIVAYKQPVTRAQISSVRGVNCDAVIRSLTVRGLICEKGYEPETRASFFVTSPLFLEKTGLESLEQLPGLAPFLPDSVASVLPEENSRFPLSQP